MDELWWLKEAVEKSGKTYMYCRKLLLYALLPADPPDGAQGTVRRGLLRRMRIPATTVTNLMKYPNGKTLVALVLAARQTRLVLPDAFARSGDAVVRGRAHCESISCFSAGHHNGLPAGRYVRNHVPDEERKIGRSSAWTARRPRPHNMTGYQLQGTRGAFESAARAR